MFVGPEIRVITSPQLAPVSPATSDAVTVLLDVDVSLRRRHVKIQKYLSNLALLTMDWRSKYMRLLPSDSRDVYQALTTNHLNTLSVDNIFIGNMVSRLSL